SLLRAREMRDLCTASKAGTRSDWFHLLCRHPTTEPRPLLDQRPPLVEEVGPPIRQLDRIATRMREARLDDLARIVRALPRPRRECRAEPVHGEPLTPQVPQQ